MTRSGTLQIRREAVSNLKTTGMSAAAFLFIAAVCYAVLMIFDMNGETASAGITEILKDTVRVITLTTGLIGVYCTIAAVSTIITIGILSAALRFTSGSAAELETNEPQANR